MKHEYILPLLLHALSNPGLRAYHNSWLVSKSLVDVLHAHYDIDECMKFNSDDITDALSNLRPNLLARHGLSYVDSFDPSVNQSNIYCVNHRKKGIAGTFLYYLHHKLQSSSSHDSGITKSPPRKRPRLRRTRRGSSINDSGGEEPEDNVECPDLT